MREQGRKKERKKVWRMPEALKKFLSGNQKAAFHSEAYLQWLGGELARVEFILDPSTHSVIREELRTNILVTWGKRIAEQHLAQNYKFFDDLKTAGRRLHDYRHRFRTRKECLAEAYCVLAQPEGVLVACVELENKVLAPFRAKYGDAINTYTVRKYADALYAHYRNSQPSDPLGQLRLDLEDHSPRQRYSEWFEELGLTKDFLPRVHYGLRKK